MYLTLTGMLYLYIFVLIHNARAFDYCEICENRTHTLCQFKEGPGALCLDYRKIDLTDQLKNYIVDIHNDIRNHVASGHELKGKLGSQPSASNMNQLEWDDELASIAQRWADQCISINSSVQHDTCKNTERFNVGQNVLTAVTLDTELPELAILILNWYKQVSDVIPSDINYFSGIRRGQFLIGQYTQLVWAKTKYIGCGMSIFRDPGNSYYYQRLVCNYGPGGNIIGDPVYVRGAPCTKCPTNRCDRYRNNLCQNLSSNHTNFAPTTILTDESFDLNHPDQSSCFIIPEDDLHSDLNNCLESLSNSVTAAQKAFQKMKIIENNAKDIDMRNNIKNVGHEAEVLIKKIRSYGLQGVYTLENVGQDKKNNSQQNELEDYETAYPKGYIAINDEEVEFPNKVRFKRAMGKWQDGHCRCNLIYRSSIALLEFQQILLTFTCFLIIL